MHTYYRKTFLLCFLFQSSGNIGRGTFTFRIPVSKIPQRVFHRNDRDIISCFIRYPNNVSFTSCIRAILKRYDTFQLVIGIYISQQFHTMLTHMRRKAFCHDFQILRPVAILAIIVYVIVTASQHFQNRAIRLLLTQQIIELCRCHHRKH